MADITQYLAQGQIVEPIAASLGISLVLICIAITVITGFALIKSIKLNEKVWFWIMLIFNTAGILPAIYLYMRRKK